MSSESTSAPRTGPATARRAPRHLRVITAASAVSKVADWQLGIVVPLAVLSESGSMAVALVAFALRWMPYAASPFLGALIDRFDKRTVFLWAQLTQALCMAGTGLLLSNRIAVALFLLLSGFGAVAVTITGQFVLIPKLLQPSEQATAVARLSAAIETSKVAGLLLGGFVLTAQGPSSAAWLTAGLYLLAGLITLLLPRIPSTGTPMKLRHDLGVGFRWIVRRDLRWLVTTMALANLAVGELETVLVTVLGSMSTHTLAISAVLSAGLLMGALGSRVCPHMFPSWSMEHRILLFQTMAFLALCVTALPHVIFTVIGYALVSFSLGGSNVASITYRQAAIPVDLAGRVNSVIRMFITGAVPLSGFLYAWATQFDGMGFWVPELAVAAGALALWTVYALRTPRHAPPVLP
ncbi:MFS transporter [[Actinomadura] parvosata]|uniref:MFS transporter n=1 Tax=[Actinomadura] parvosata TaxID=1955412 RepID=UPI00406C36FC